MTSPAGGSTPDPLGSAAIRAATLSAWLSSPTRLREDANVEEDHARGSYRDRAVVELAQNAADAAADAAVGAPSTPTGSGRLLLRLHTWEGGALLAAANTGAPLTPEGVAALASMRASSKSAASGVDTGGATVGRFGVGFSAVRALSDEIAISSARGGVRFSASAVHHLLARLATEHATADERVRQALLAALERPFADLPILRLPFPLDDADRDDAPHLPVTVPPGYDTAVIALLRGRQETELVRRLLAEVDDALLLALPALEEIRIEVEGEEPRVLRGAAERWRTIGVEGKHRPADLADRPHEERTRTGWRLTWAVPRRGGASSVHEPHVLHAPTPTEEPLSFPALLVATFPLEPSRRHIAPGPATEALARHAGEAYAALVEQVARDGEDPLPLVPTGPVGGRLDAALREAATQALRRCPLLTPVAAEGGDQPARLLSPREAQAVVGAVGHDRSALRVLSRLVPHLVVLPSGHDAQLRLRALGLQMRELGDVVDGLPLTLEPARWREVYEALDPHVGEPGVVDALSGLPVPLVDGALVRGPRGLLLPSGSDSPRPQAAAALAPWGLRVVDPTASHPLLRRLGATEGSPRGLLHHPALRAAVTALASDVADPDLDHVDGGPARVRRPVEPATVRDAILEVVGAAIDAGADPDELAGAFPWLGSLPLPAHDGEPIPARELTLPGSWAERVLDALPPLDAALVARHGGATLKAVGVREGLTVVRLSDVVAEEAPGLGTPGDAPEDLLDRWPEYLLDLAEVVGAGAYVGEVSAVADLDAVGDDAWPEVLARLAIDPQARAALLSPVRGRGGREAPSYTGWWLRGFLDAPFAAPGASVPFLPAAPREVRAAEASAPLGDDVLAALGAVRDLTDLDAAGWERLLDHLPEVGHEVPMGDAVAVWRGLAALLAEVPDDAARFGPDRLPVLAGTDGQGRPTAVIAAADDVAVAPEPMWAQVARALVPAAASVAEALADALDVLLLGDGPPPTVSAEGALEAPTPGAVLALLPGAPLGYLECEELSVDGAPVEWWVSGDQVWATTTAGLARALAQAAGQWEARALVESLLADPGRAADLLLERGWDGPQAVRKS